MSRCESDRDLLVEPCVNQTVVSWLDPVWADDHTGMLQIYELLEWCHGRDGAIICCVKFVGC